MRQKDLQEANRGLRFGVGTKVVKDSSDSDQGITICSSVLPQLKNATQPQLIVVLQPVK
jgi:hypothetical protein